jgi:hypothetical protein
MIQSFAGFFKKSIIPFLSLFIIISYTGQAQSVDSSSTEKIIYKYTFEGMRDSSETIKIENAILKLKGVTSAHVIFKSSQHQYALLKVEIEVISETNENYKGTTGPLELKKTLSAHGYMPAECKIDTEKQ